MVSAPLVARERGVMITETRKDAQGAFGSYMRLIVTTEAQTRSVAGTIYSDGRPRFIQIKGINLEAEPMKFMLYTTNTDTPGYIGALGTRLGTLGINIATFALGREQKSGEAIALLGVDEDVAPEALGAIATLPQIRQAKALRF
jgi:D-3-phosphoglycerate dehydrogenase